jgi:hypothetical protein
MVKTRISLYSNSLEYEFNQLSEIIKGMTVGSKEPGAQ